MTYEHFLDWSIEMKQQNYKNLHRNLIYCTLKYRWIRIKYSVLNQCKGEKIHERLLSKYFVWTNGWKLKNRKNGKRRHVDPFNNVQLNVIHIAKWKGFNSFPLNEMKWRWKKIMINVAGSVWRICLMSELNWTIELLLSSLFRKLEWMKTATMMMISN